MMFGQVLLVYYTGITILLTSQPIVYILFTYFHLMSNKCHIMLKCTIITYFLQNKIHISLSKF